MSLLSVPIMAQAKTHSTDSLRMEESLIHLLFSDVKTAVPLENFLRTTQVWLLIGVLV